MKEDKRRRQEETKAVLDYSLKLKMKKKAKDVQQELALDMKLLEQMLAATSNEAMQSLQRKVGSETDECCVWEELPGYRKVCVCVCVKDYVEFVWMCKCKSTYMYIHVHVRQIGEQCYASRW